ncbi:MAG: sulfotransferase domain-containing protein [Xanthomonadales bacterium]|jgi:hypothetical protein|nr:sulfotransferase domain-containing protein [Xanthomonadales bacterium]
MARPQLIHCSTHKCLTVYYRRVMDALLNRCFRWRGDYRHFNSDLDAFRRDFARHRLASVNGHALDLDSLGDFRLSRFVRDPRDLVVSGYFYHRRGAEAWCTLENPTDGDWAFANGRVPEGLKASGRAFSTYLQSVSEEEGLLAEIEFRERHFQAMAAWPERHPQVLLLRYEDVLGREVETFDRLFEHYELSPVERRLGRFFARRHSLARRRPNDAHIRNPASGQWKQHFTPRVREAFNDRWAGLVARYGYEPG